MKSLIVCVAALILSGCGTTGVTRMSPEQIKATAGMAICDDGDAIYPGAAARGTTIIANVDDVRKGATSKGKMTITCGKSTMTIETDVGVALPPGTINTIQVPGVTTTTITPAPPTRAMP